MRPYSQPEIVRVPLEELVLQVGISWLFLMPLIDVAPVTEPAHEAGPHVGKPEEQCGLIAYRLYRFVTALRLIAYTLSHTSPPLQIHLMKLGPAAGFLTKVLEPPPAKSVAAALASLREVGGLCTVPSL